MEFTTYTYPPKPENIDEKVIEVSPAFKQEVFKVGSAILFFIATYILLVAIAILMAFGAGYLGLMLILIHPSIMTLVFGVGFIGFGLLVVFFLFKFLFKRNKVDRSGLIELKQNDQPELFAFVAKITKETQTPFPKKIYLSPDVNACVFYDSSFLSLFLPVRKNLQIGLGLVNAINISEFKAVLAHEFGHFSQRSMKLGSYVYNVNHVIFNMLYDNDGYSKALQGFANVSAYFTIFARLTAFIISGIQWVLQKVYAVVNKSYMSLSRQMEFHADSVAAYVTGSKHLITALKRIEVASLCYENLFQSYNQWVADNKKPDNIYPQHLEVIQHFSKEFELSLEHELPNVNIDLQQALNPSRLVIKDQWASHPSTEARENHLNKLNIPSQTFHETAWCVFIKKAELQEQMTQKLYQEVIFKSSPTTFNISEFRDLYYQGFNDNSFDKRYHGFYNNHNISQFDLDEESNKPWANDFKMEELFSVDQGRMAKKLSSLKTDVESIDWLINNKSDVKTFDFNGQKYKLKEAPSLLNQLKEELNQLENDLGDFDKRVFRFFFQKAKTNNQGENLIKAYQNYYKAMYQSEDDYAICNHMNSLLQNLFTSQMSIEQARMQVRDIKDLEVRMKEQITEFLKESDINGSFCNTLEKDILENFIRIGQTYLYTESFNEDALQKLNDAVAIFAQVLSNRIFKNKKKVLDSQIELL